MKIKLLSLLVIIIAVDLFAQNESGAEYCADKNLRQDQIHLEKDVLETSHSFDVLDYNVNFNLFNCFRFPYPNSFTAREVITLRVDSALNSIKLDASNSSINITSVSLAGISFTHNANILTINLNRIYNPGETLQVGIDYTHMDVTDNAFYADGGFVFTDNEPERARNWLPSWDKPSDKATINFRVKTPADVKLGSNGRLADSVMTADTIYYNWISRDPVATYLMVLTGKVNYNLDIVQYTDSLASFPIRFYWNTGENTDNLNQIKSMMTPLTQLFHEKYAPHPFEKNGFATLNSQFQWGGMENQTLTSLCPNCWGEYLIVHEYAHQWFGDMITCKTWADIWLNEGFASYSEALWTERKSGHQAYKAHIIGNASNYMNGNPGWAISDPAWAIVTPPSSTLFNFAVTYMKSSVVLHLLRYTLGDDMFFQVIRNYAEHPDLKYKSADTRDFNNVVNTVTGENYDWFFSQWIYAPNHPNYQNEYYIADNGNNSWQVGFRAKQNLGSNIFFKMPIEIKINFANAADTLVRVFNESNNQMFTFNFDRQPASVEFDPSNEIVIKTASLTQISPVSVDDGTAMPEEFSLEQNYPNPFNPSTTIKLNLPEERYVTLAVHNLLGERIAVIAERLMKAGTYEFSFDASAIPSGIYFYRIDAGEYTAVKKMTVIK